jgi:hypothetical protein
MMDVVGVVVLVALVPASWMFNAGWSARHPGRRWPLKAILAITGATVAASGLVIASMPVVVIGAACYFAQFIAPTPSRH